MPTPPNSRQSLEVSGRESFLHLFLEMHFLRALFFKLGY